MILPLLVTAGCLSDAGPDEATTRRVVADYMQEVWVERRVESIDRYVHPDLIQHNRHLPNGSAALAEFLPVLFGELMPDGEWRILRMMADDDLAAVHSHVIPQPGSLGMVVVDVFRVADDKIVEHWDVSNDVPETTVSGNTVY